MKKFCLLKFSVRAILDTYLWGHSSRFRARVAKGRPGFQDRITRGKPRVQNCISRGRCRLRKTENILSAHNDRETWNVDKSSFQKTMKKFWLRKFLVRVILDTYLLEQSSRFRARVAKGRSPSAIALQGGSLESKILFRGVGANSKNRKYIFASKAQTTHPLPVPRL